MRGRKHDVSLALLGQLATLRHLLGGRRGGGRYGDRSQLDAVALGHAKLAHLRDERDQLLGRPHGLFARLLALRASEVAMAMSWRCLARASARTT